MALTCTPQALAPAAACLDCGLTRKQLAAIEAFILAQMALNIGLIGSASVSSLIAASTCYNCYSTKQMEMVIIYLLCQLSNAIGIGGGLNLSSSPPALMALAKCFHCGLTKRQMLMIDIYALAQLADSQGLVPGTDASSLLAAANCMDCLTPKMRDAVTTNLYCQLNNT